MQKKNKKKPILHLVQHSLSVVHFTIKPNIAYTAPDVQFAAGVGMSDA